MPSFLAGRLRKKNFQLYWILIFIGFIVFNFAVMLLGEYDFNRVMLIYIFFSISVFPYFLLRTDTGRYLLLAIFLAFYFVLFGLGEMLHLLGLNDDFYYGPKIYIKPVDMVIGIGLISTIVGYFIIMGLGGKQWRGIFRNDWHPSKSEKLGLIMWILGTWAFIALFFELSTLKIPPSIVSNMKQLAPFGASILMYLYFKDPNKRLLIFVLLIMSFEFILGFAANHKEISFRLPLLFILMSFLFRGKINLYVLSAVILIMTVYFTYFNAYRLNVIQMRDQTPIEALKNISKSLDQVMHAVNSKHQHYKLNTSILGRITTRQYIIILVEGIDSGHETRNGETLVRYLYSFIPRMFWPEKPVLTIGQEFNQEFKISKSPETFIPTTQLGEFYWNYKLPGVVIGMMFIGMILGLISKLLDLSVQFNIPRIALILATVYMLAVRFEATFALQYSKLTRIFLLMIILHFMFKKRKIFNNAK